MSSNTFHNYDSDLTDLEDTTNKPSFSRSRPPSSSSSSEEESDDNAAQSHVNLATGFVQPAYPPPSDAEYLAFLRARAKHKELKAKASCNQAMEKINREHLEAAKVPLPGDAMRSAANSVTTSSPVKQPEPIPSSCKRRESWKEGARKSQDEATKSKAKATVKSHTKEDFKNWTWPDGDKSFCVPVEHQRDGTPHHGWALCQQNTSKATKEGIACH